MAGRGSRFADAGYATPKPFIEVHGIPMISFVMRNLTPSQPHRFILVALEEHVKEYNLEAVARTECPDTEIVTLSGVSEGPACSVMAAWPLIDPSQPLLIANSDQWVAPSVDELINAATGFAGALMTMPDSDPKWSFVRRDPSGRIDAVLEKQPVSNEATVGIYYFSQASLFAHALDVMIETDERVNGEFYVGPGYNVLLDEGLDINTLDVGAIGVGMHGLGIPSDLDDFLTSGLGLDLASTTPGH